MFWGYAARFASVLNWTSAFRQPHWRRSIAWWAHRFLGLGHSNWNLRFPTIGDWYRAKHTRIPEPWLNRIFPEGPDWPAAFGAFSFDGSSLNETAQWLRWNEFQVHLAMVLMKVDGASMHESLEVRVPLLDREVLQVAERVDWQSCLDLETGIGKLPLRKSLRRQVGWQSQEKKGFWVPMGDWLRGPLRELFEERVLSRNHLAGVPINNRSLRELWQSHQQGKDFAWGLWILLSLALWEGRHLDARSHPVWSQSEP
ncbi:MAG: asparagine synthase-related protein [Thermoanaerobaculia bacterium]